MSNRFHKMYFPVSKERGQLPPIGQVKQRGDPKGCRKTQESAEDGEIPSSRLL